MRAQASGGVLARTHPRLGLLTRLFPKADLDQDGKVDAQEALQFLQVQAENSMTHSWERRYGGQTHRVPDYIEKWGRRPFYITGSAFMVGSIGLSINAGALCWFAAVPTALFWFIGLKDIAQNHSTIRRNFPVIGNIRYILESIRPEIRQYFIESDHEEAPFSRANRSIVYSRSKGEGDTQSFGTRANLEDPTYMWFNHSLFKATDMDPAHTRTRVGVGDITYDAALLNISGMSYGALSSAAVKALNMGAKKGDFYHNTGEGGVSDWHKCGGADIAWNIGTGYFGCRDMATGGFSREIFSQTLKEAPQIRMIELKLSQGAKPGHGGLLPGAKVTPEIARVRGIPAGKDCHSPALHTAFSGPEEMADFIAELRELSQRPVGVKLCVGDRIETAAMIRALKDNPCDFITVDGGEGGTGAAPFEFSNRVGTPLSQGIVLVDDLLRGAGLRDRIKIIGSGKVASAFGLCRTLAYGADFCNAARSMMFALGCIQALKCNTNKCPVGVTTQDPVLIAGLNYLNKAERVFQFQKRTVEASCDLMGAMGLDCPSKMTREFLMMREGGGVSGSAKSFAQFHPIVPSGALLEGKADPDLQRLWDQSAQLMKRRG